ncbi:hypothetical protein VTK73DRAFT_314 [Phialemonium thermophilum]|uniref:BNR repeat-containing family member n=1 Tax=Phialemonium thermophilum TaxID=223376 RepID=A0ABR3VVX7_9PEZI
MQLSDPRVTVLGPDPPGRACILNGNAFQQDAITTFRGWQYAAFYSGGVGRDDVTRVEDSSPRGGGSVPPAYVHLARRKLPGGAWEVLVFGDYPQTVDDGHNTVQMGVCPGDGTVHLAYDHHCDRLRFRHSVRGLALTPERFAWTPDLFTPTLDHLPGLPSDHKPFGYVTYPRFGPLRDGRGSLFCTFRDGKAGLGNDHLYVYEAATGRYSYVGAHLTGVRSSPYVHGLDSGGRCHDDGDDKEGGRRRLHVTWVYRAFVEYEGWDDPLDTKHKQQAGPNGAENNHDLCYAYSDDGGRTWRNGAGEVVAADLDKGGSVRNDSPGIVAVEIPKGRGLTNQEAQAVDGDGGVHVLNRDDLDGELRWKHYYRSPDTGIWSSRALTSLPPTRRGQLAVTRQGDLLVVLPDPAAEGIRIVRASRASRYASYEEVWSGRRGDGGGLSGEPLVDKLRLLEDDVLSVFVRAQAVGQPGTWDVVVMDFQV